MSLTWYPDVDRDGYGDPAVSTQACQAPAGYSSNGSDCDDTTADHHPGNPEACDGRDNDCSAVQADAPGCRIRRRREGGD